MSETVKVDRLPECDFRDSGPCDGLGVMYDFRTAMGPWANACARHWRIYRASSQLGTGHGQRLEVTDGHS